MSGSLNSSSKASTDFSAKPKYSPLLADLESGSSTSSSNESVASTTLFGRLQSNFQQIGPRWNHSSQTIDARRAELLKHDKKEADIRDNTLFWRVTGENLGLQDPSKKGKAFDLKVGICDGEFKYEASSEDLRRLPASTLVQAATATALAASSIVSYAYTGEGIVTRGLLNTLCGFIAPKLGQIPYLPQIAGPAALATGAYFASKALDSTPYGSYAKAALVGGLAMSALLYKRGGKALSTGGWAAFKKYVIPTTLTKPTPSDFLRIPITPMDPKGALSVEAFLELKTVNDEVFYSLVLKDSDGKEKTFGSELMGSKVDDDDDDEDEGKKKVKDKKKDNKEDGQTLLVSPGSKLEKVKKEKTDSNDNDTKGEQKIKTKKDKGETPVVALDDNTNEIQATKVKSKDKPGKADKKEKKDKSEVTLAQRVKEGVLFAGSGLATATSTYFLGEGITTNAINTIFSASVKAKFRLQPFANSYGYLLAASGAGILAKTLYPNSLIGSLYFVPISILTSIANKDIKDRIVTGKDPKNRNLYEVPTTIQKIAHTFFGWEPAPFKTNHDPLEQVLEKDNQGKSDIKFNAQTVSPQNPDEEVRATLKISGKRLSGTYELSAEKQQQLHLARLKAKKLGNGPEAAFLAASVGATLGASFLTCIFQGGAMLISGDPTRINAEQLGEGVVANILNSVFSTYMKQVGKKLPTVPRDGGLLLTAVGAIALERILMDQGILPVLFSSIPTSAFLAIQSKKAKQWVYNKPYGKTTGWVSSKWPTDQDLSQTWESLKRGGSKCIRCTREQFERRLGEQNDEDLLLMRRVDGTEDVELLSLSPEYSDMVHNRPETIDV